MIADVMFNFEKLETWQSAVDLSGRVYQATKRFPPDERYGLTNQIRRASCSVAANLAEGSSRHSPADYARFVEIATGSLFEVISHLFMARHLNILPDSDFKEIYRIAETQSRRMSGLYRMLREKARGEGGEG